MGSHPSRHTLSEEQRLEHLRQSPFGVFIKDEDMGSFLTCWEPVIAHNGEHLPSSHGETYFICEGSVDVSTILPKVGSDHHDKVTEGVHVELCSKKKGQLLNLAVTVGKALDAARYPDDAHRRQAKTLCHKIETTEMICTSDQCDLLKLNHQKLATFTAANPETGQKLKSVLSSDLIDYLKKIPFLKDLPSSKLVLFSKMCSYETFETGQDVFREYDPGTSMSICLHGRFEISTSSLAESSPRVDPGVINSPGHASGLREVVNKFAHIDQGDFFGEMSLIIDMPRLATVTATERSLVITVSKTNFCNFIKVVPEMGNVLRTDVQKRMMEKLYACKIPFFSGITLEKLLSLNGYCDIVEKKPGDVVIKQGAPCSNFYMIVCGECTIEVSKEIGTTANSILVNTVGPGGYFGELSMILNEETHATVTAKEQAVLLSIAPEHFPRFFGGNLHMMAEVRIRLGGYKVPLRHFLMHTVGRKIFSEHLEREHSGEHLVMLDAIIKHEDEFEIDDDSSDDPNPSSIEKRLKNIEDVYENFIKDGSPFEVNIPATMKEEILEEIQNKTATVGCFNHIKHEVQGLMERDNFARFIKGKEFKAFLEEIGGLYTGVTKEVANSKRVSIQMRNRFV